MNTKNEKLVHQLKNALIQVLKFFKTVYFNTINKKQFYLPLVFMIFLFSCKKEPELIAPNNLQNTPQALSIVCGTTEYLKQQLISDPGLRTRMASIEQSLQLRSTPDQFQPKMLALNSAMIIPVVVHVVYNTAEQNISDAQVLSQIDVLNEDYSKTNADAINTPVVFQPFAANANIQFVLARRDPNGNATSGITRTYSANSSFSSNNYVKFTNYGGFNAWPTDQYLNIWVCNLGLCGYATYPGGAPAVDGVVVKYNCFGRTGTLQTSYNKGRTATHEVAHWLCVYHIWGDAVCGDDLVSDTPVQEKSNSGYPVYPLLSACSSNAYGDMFMNYMDYTADGARNMMTQGQVARMNATLNGPRSSILSSLGALDPSVTPTVCDIPSGLNSTSISTGSATLNWSSTGAANYNVQYKATTSATWNTALTTSTSLPIIGLSSSTTYEFQVAGVCSGTSSSAFSSSSMFTTSAIVCNVPAGLIATLITQSSAALNWSSTGALSYMLRYKPSAAITWLNVTTASPSVTVGSLLSSTIYEFQVAGVCSGTSSSAFSSSSMFTTSAIACNVPAGLNATLITKSSAVLNWSSSGALSYMVRYKPSASSIWMNATTSSPSLAVSSLLSSTIYEFQVVGVCSGTTSSAYSVSSLFTTLAAGTGKKK